MKRLFLAFVMFSGMTVVAQTDYVAVSGRVVCGSKGVPYATLQLSGTAIGVSCNDAGEYEMRVPTGADGDTVVVRSVGYGTVKITVGELRRTSRVKMREQAIMLKTVLITDFRYPRDLLMEAVDRISQNYQKDSCFSTFFFRDWRAVDDELYLFDEAVIRMRRSSYAEYNDKNSYGFVRDEPEMPTDYKVLLKHRLLVYDRDLLVRKTGRKTGADEMLEYADNECFFDPVYTPKASYLFAHRFIEKQKFEAVKEFEDNGEIYYVLRSRLRQIGAGFEYIIRKSDLAIVQIKSKNENSRVVYSPLNRNWVNWEYNRLTYDVDSSLWCYDVREGQYTLTRYSNYKEFHLGKSKKGKELKAQRWQCSVDWILTDFSTTDEKKVGDTIVVRPQTLGQAFGASDYQTSFWGRYNSIVIDALPLRLLQEKLLKRYPQ